MIHDYLQPAADILTECFRRGGKLLLCGNGGSAADCAHITGELAKGFILRRPLPDALKAAIHQPWADSLQMALPAIDLTCNNALISAIANDLGGENAYAQQVMAYGRPGDVIIGISTSRNAENVCRAQTTAKALGLQTVGLTGSGGGHMIDLCDLLVKADASETYLVQEEHLSFYHRPCIMAENALFADA